MNKSVKKPSVHFYSEEHDSRLETKMREKKELTRTNQFYNHVLKDMEVDDLENIDEMEDEIFVHGRTKGRK